MDDDDDECIERSAVGAYGRPCSRLRRLGVAVGFLPSVLAHRYQWLLDGSVHTFDSLSLITFVVRELADLRCA